MTLSSPLEGLSPASVWRHFASLSALPRASQAEARARDHLRSLAAQWGLSATQDTAGNLLVRKPASPGREGRPSVLLQAHLDMVCEKDRDSDHDFASDPLKLAVTEGWVHAIGTTLGADDGIGVAVILAILEDRTLVHGPLEALFTVDEELEMTGAAGLDASAIGSRIILNLDGEGSGVFIIGSAGGSTSTGRLGLSLGRSDAEAGWQILVRGLEGGHSGVEIHRQTGNALGLAARFVSAFIEAQSPGSWQLSHFEGGDKDNAIPREALVLLAGPTDGSALRAFAQTQQTLWATELGPEGRAVSIEVTEAALPSVILSPASQQTLLGLLASLPDGVQGRSKLVPGLVETSCNLGRLRIEDGQAIILVSERSSVPGLLKDLVRRVGACFRLAGGQVVQSGDYPAWSPAAQSRLRELAPSLWRTTTSRGAVVEVIHAGLECGFLAQKLPGADMISFGANLQDIHTPRERVEVSSVGLLYSFVLTLLEAL